MSKNQQPDPIILNYNDSLLYESDLRLLTVGQWLNDRLIGFIYEYFELEAYKSECTSDASGSRHLAFVNPSTVQYMKLCETIDEAKMCFIEPLGLDRARLVLMPLNDNANPGDCGGSHWSLLVLDKQNAKFVHYDSIGSNEKEAVLFVNKYKKCFRAEKLEICEKYPKQSNFSDCGVFVLGKTYLMADI
jgi:sentrin-specific protease 8